MSIISLFLTRGQHYKECKSISTSLFLSLFFVDVEASIIVASTTVPPHKSFPFSSLKI